MDCRTSQEQHRITPIAMFSSFYIPIGYVAPANEPHSTVNYNNFAMIAVIYLVGKNREADLQEGLYIYTRAAHALEKVFFHIPTPYAVIYHTHLDTLSGLHDKSITQLPAEFVILEYIELQMYMFLGTVHFAQQDIRKVFH
jgi:hypothetical protein